MTENEVAAAILGALGCLLIFWRSRRKFTRLNGNGIEQFPSHWSMLASTVIDLMLFCVSTIAIATSALILVFAERQVVPAFLISLVVLYQFRSTR